jgi:hypothetical protein
MGVVDLVQTMLVSGVATTVATQLLKSKYIPIQFQKFPRVTALFVSIGATVFVAWQQCNDLATGCSGLLTSPIDWTAAVLGTLLVSTLTYNNIVNVEGSRTKL